jgi:SAM-dependent methyltransferase
MNWRVKGLLQGIISRLPGRSRLNRILQRRFGGLRDPLREIDAKVVEDWLVFAGHMRALSLEPGGLTLLEIGTGLYPTLPMCFAVTGVSAVDTYDQVRQLDDELTWLMVRRLDLHLDRLATATGQSVESVRARYDRLVAARSTPDLLAAAGIRYYAPADASRTGLPDASVDVVFSNSVLEHVTPGALGAIMTETARVLRPGGHAVHSVNCGDHYAHSDPSITQVNYLRYPDRHWLLWNNDLQYQNRLRAPDFVRASEAVGLATVFSSARPKPELMTEVARMTLPARFHSYTLEELAITSIDFAARKPFA